MRPGEEIGPRPHPGVVLAQRGGERGTEGDLRDCGRGDDLKSIRRPFHTRGRGTSGTSIKVHRLTQIRRQRNLSEKRRSFVSHRSRFAGSLPVCGQLRCQGTQRRRPSSRARHFKCSTVMRCRSVRAVAAGDRTGWTAETPDERWVEDPYPHSNPAGLRQFLVGARSKTVT